MSIAGMIQSALLKGRKASGPHSLAPLFAALGMNVDAAVLTPDQVEQAFRSAALATRIEGASVVRIVGQMEDGSMVQSLTVVMPQVTKVSQKILDAGTALL